MQIPKLKPAQRTIINKPFDGPDALLLAQILQNQAKNQQISVLITEKAFDAQRLLEEIAFFAPSLRLALFPDWETLPYDNFSPHQDLISERLATLYGVLEKQIDVLILPASTALYRLAPTSFIAGNTFIFKKNQKLNEAALRQQLVLAGYSHVGQVLSAGEYSIRGSLIDIFPMGSATPFRLDLFDDEIDSIRSFDPETQRSLESLQSIRILPGREFASDDAGRQRFNQRWLEVFDGNFVKSRIHQDAMKGVFSAGIEYYLPLFFEKTQTIFDYVSDTKNGNEQRESPLIVLHGAIENSFETFLSDANQRYKLLQNDPDQPILKPNDLFLSAEQFFVAIQSFAQLSLREKENVSQRTASEHLGKNTAGNEFFTALPPISANRTQDEPLLRLKEFLGKTSYQTLVLVQSLGRQESLLDFMRSSGINPATSLDLQEFLGKKDSLGIAVGNLAQGFIWHDAKLNLVTEYELFATQIGGHRRKSKRQERVSDIDALVKDLSELNIGDPVVHAQYGIGRYQGLIEMEIGQTQGEFLHLVYAQDAALYVPVSQLHQISRYTGVSPEEAPLYKLGSGQWEKAKRKAAEQIRDTAAELLDIYARREVKEGHAFRYSGGDYENFAKDFGFEETPDQQAAIHAVLQDMTSPKPMDRLICGDVGFGKTEVALRAAFVAVMGGKQVAFLAPTTLLAEQHYQSLQDRFSQWPVKIAEMSRFRTPKETQQAINGLATGSIDIVIGTHKLLSNTVKFKNLGLLIIDEEHRFGVRHKEVMKAMRADVDVLTLTATPIPRTLGMALEGLRDLSVIATAPQRRLSIKTFVRSENSGVIREAVLREFKRGGQVYFLHNDVKTIDNRLSYLSDIIPQARIAIAHGQMPERELEHVMKDFIAQRYNILLCSTIIETGIDVPTANTIIISRSDKFGLAQLHQLRGRVGRSHHQAYAYLMVPDVQSLTKQAAQRLQAISEMQELGSGFYLAMHDLEIRGTGEVLGEKQSGNMIEIGFQLYNEMLSQAVRSLKEGKEPDLLAPLTPCLDINLHTPTLLPSSYCGDVHQRLSFYKKLAVATSHAQLDDLLEELVDRFGKLPDEVGHLFEVHRLRLMSEAIGILKIDANISSITLTFKPNPPFDAMRIIELIQKNRYFKLAGNDKLRIERSFSDVKDRVRTIQDVVRHLKSP